MLIPALGLLAIGAYLWSRDMLFRARCEADYPVSHIHLVLPLLIVLFYLAAWNSRAITMQFCRLCLPLAFWMPGQRSANICRISGGWEMRASVSWISARFIWRTIWPFRVGPLRNVPAVPDRLCGACGAPPRPAVAGAGIGPRNNSSPFLRHRPLYAGDP
ncbi:MAG TPA: hypothetical protein VGM26_15690 [Rhizomicrobium sp.]